MNTFRSLAVVSLLALAGNAFAADKVCKLEITGTDAMQYDKKELSVAGDCTQVELTLHHSGKLPAQAMGHNWVLSKTGDVAGIASDGVAAGFANDHIKKGDTRVIAHTKIVGGGQTTSVTFPTSALKAGESYTYFCSFPGHSSIMKGVFKFG
ncbi:MAG TPA: azurin [Steroidobacteraceae bacterium]|jgi:azurin|nr:azurin [Steroidobacteraceae bacterium]